MHLPIEDLTPRQIVAELDKYIIGQAPAKRAVAVALRNRFRRQRVPMGEREEIVPKNILMIGPTGVGKTEIARRLAQLARAPFIKVEATKFTEVGYVGRDVESMVRDLAAAAVRLVEAERLEAARPAVEDAVVDQLVELLDDTNSSASRAYSSSSSPNPLFRQALEMLGHVEPEQQEPEAVESDQEAEQATREHRSELRRALLAGELESRYVTIEVEEQNNPFLQVFTPQGMEEMGLDMLGSLHGPRRVHRTVMVSEARTILTESQAKQHLDQSSLNREAIHRAEQTGIIFLDEIDKVAMKSGGGAGPDVSREGVQRDLLPVIEGTTVTTKFGQVKTDHVLFIAAGAFHESQPSDLIPELQGRLPIRVELDPLSPADLRRILNEPQNALTKQYASLLKVEGVELTFDAGALDEIAKLAAEVNERTEDIGARRLHTMLERLLEQTMFDAPDKAPPTLVITRKFVADRLSSLVKDGKASRSIL